MAFLASIAIVAATKLGFKVAEKKKWLPKSIYHQLALDKMQHGELFDAMRLNEIALQKNPNYEKALIVKDLIAMRRDALLNNLLRDIDQETRAIKDLGEENRAINRRLARYGMATLILKIAPWLFLFINIFTYLASYLFFVRAHHLIWGSLLGGFGVMCTMLVFYFFRLMHELEIKYGIQQDELLAAQKSMAKELDIRTRRLRQLQSKLLQTRYQLRVK